MMSGRRTEIYNIWKVSNYTLSFTVHHHIAIINWGVDVHFESSILWEWYLIQSVIFQTSVSSSLPSHRCLSLPTEVVGHPDIMKAATHSIPTLTFKLHILTLCRSVAIKGYYGYDITRRSEEEIPIIWDNMLSSAKQIHKYSRQTREKSKWKTRVGEAT